VATPHLFSFLIKKILAWGGLQYLTNKKKGKTRAPTDTQGPEERFSKF